jgi:hypothetical protein
MSLNKKAVAFFGSRLSRGLRRPLENPFSPVFF